MGEHVRAGGLRQGWIDRHGALPGSNVSRHSIVPGHFGPKVTVSTGLTEDRLLQRAGSSLHRMAGAATLGVEFLPMTGTHSGARPIPWRWIAALWCAGGLFEASQAVLIMR